eukprot:5056-Pelagococcus_subviridis.AAC.1
MFSITTSTPPISTGSLSSPLNATGTRKHRSAPRFTTASATARPIFPVRSFTMIGTGAASADAAIATIDPPLFSTTTRRGDVLRDRIRARGSTSAKERGADGDARSARTERAGGAGPTSAAGDDIVDVAGIARGGRVTAGRGGDRGRRGRVGALKARRAARDLPPATE